MDPQPKAIRPYILLTTAFVLFGGAAGFALFIQQRSAPSEAPRLAPDTSFDAVVTRSLSPPASMDAAERARLAATIEKATNEPDADVRRAASDVLVALGAKAVPSLLDLLHGFASSPAGFTDQAARFRLSAADLPLRKIRAQLTPDHRSAPYVRAPNAAWALRRAKSWFAWWDSYGATHPELR